MLFFLFILMAVSLLMCPPLFLIAAAALGVTLIVADRQEQA